MDLLDRDTLARRIVSARELRGMSQNDVGEAMKAEGYGKHDVAKMERLDPSAPPLNRGRRICLAEILGVPEWWFTEADEELFVDRATDLSDHDRRMFEFATGVRDEQRQQHESLVKRLDWVTEVLADHLLPFLAEQMPTPADDLPQAPGDASTARPSRRTNSSS